MRYVKRKGKFVGNGVEVTLSPLNAVTNTGWEIIRVINGVAVFNLHTPTMRMKRQLSNVWKLFVKENMFLNNPYVLIESPLGLDNLESAIELYDERNRRLWDEIMKKGSHRPKNRKRSAKIDENNRIIGFIREKLMVPVGGLCGPGHLEAFVEGTCDSLEMS